MLSSRSFTPVVSAAFGAAIGYYFLSQIYRYGIVSRTGFYLILLGPLAAICFFRVIALFPLYSHIRVFRLAARYSLACTAGIVIGIGAGANAVPRFDLGLPREKITGISGTLLEDPRIISRGRVTALLGLSEVSADRGLRASAHGELTVIFPSENSMRLKEFGRSCSIYSTGTIQDSASGPLFIADSLHITRPAGRLENFRTAVRNSLGQRFNARGDTWGALSLALLLGIRDNLDLNLSGLYRDAGCSYILALSGMHLAVIASIIALLLKKPLGQKASAMTGAALIVIYCITVGPLPSLYRAALMYLLGVFAALSSLKRDVFSLLCMAFIIQIIAVPSSGYSVSFVLSYLALAGILSAGEAVNFIFKGKIPSVLLGPLSASLGAFLLTAGITSYYFTLLRPIGIVTGLALVPLTTVFMIGSIIWLVFDIISPWLSGILRPVLSLLYKLMEKTVATAAHAPPLKAGGFWPVLIISLALTAFIIWYADRRRVSRNSFPALS